MDVVALDILPGRLIFLSDTDAPHAIIDVSDIDAVYTDEKRNVIVSFRTGWWLAFKGINAKDVADAMAKATKHRQSELGVLRKKRAARRA